MLKRTTTIETYIPVTKPEVITNSATEEQLIEAAPALGPILSLLRQSAPIGQVGNYIGVYEISNGVEGFTPKAGANPTLGELDLPEATASLRLKTYVPGGVQSTVIAHFVQKLAAIHPWEHPIIEVQGNSGLLLWMPPKIRKPTEARSARKKK